MSLIGYLPGFCEELFSTCKSESHVLCHCDPFSTESRPGLVQSHRFIFNQFYTFPERSVPDSAGPVVSGAEGQFSCKDNNECLVHLCNCIVIDET